jgi:hypothetical protein
MGLGIRSADERSRSLIQHLPRSTRQRRLQLNRTSYLIPSNRLHGDGAGLFSGQARALISRHGYLLEPI